MDQDLARKIAARFVALPEREGRLFAQKMREQGIAFAQLPVPPFPRNAPLPLSHAQQRMWFLWNLQPDSRAYHIDAALALEGALNIAAVRASFDTIVARHEALRTTFRSGPDGHAQQVIDPQPRYDFRVADVADRPDRDDAAAAWAQSLAAEPFDLVAGPLLRVGVVRLGDERHRLVVAMHHIVADGWSMGVLLREFAAAYGAHARGAAVLLPALPVQYADCAVWQRRWLEAGEQDRQLGWWRERLGDAQPVLALQTDRPRQATGVLHAALERIALPDDFAATLRRVARERQATPFMVLLAAFHALLHRYTGETDIRIGVPVANRNRLEAEGLIGLFVNTQVHRAELDGRTTLAALLDQVKAHAREAQAHADLPFDVLVDALQPERSLSHTPLFQVMFNHRQDDWRAFEVAPGLTIERAAAGERAAQFELTLETEEAQDGTLTATLVYARELFDAATMRRFGRHYARMLGAFGDPALATGAIGVIELLNDDERAAQLAAGCNGTTFANTRPVHALIGLQAAKTPDSVALVCGGRALTYCELDARANRLAHRLVALGVRPEARVGIALGRSPEMVVGLLAVLKAGAAYVPLDPDYPRERIAAMIEDSGIALLLTQGSVRERLSVPAHVTALDLDALVADESVGEPMSAPDIAIDGEQIAYMIYTSGSTGRPKGVMVRHAALTNFLLATQQTPGLAPSDRLVAVTSLSFDIAALELYLPLVTGACTILASREAARDGRELARLLHESGATVMQSTPATWRMLLESGWRGGPLKSLCGGEALPSDLAEALRAAGVELWNMYGPTETTIWSSAQRVEARPALGAPLAATGFFVLDAGMNLVPVGAAGELHIGGAGVARGYWRRAALSAERFVPDPFSANGGRLYRTGDRVRWSADGALEYLGRVDHQVKVRGFRVEPGEIDAQLSLQPGVREAVVVALPGPGGAQLVAYVSAQAGHLLDTSALRAALAERLPDYMVPAAIVVLDALPQTPNGKIDRRALPAPVFASMAQAEPEGATEATLAAIWREVLDVARVSRDDSFFALGGHSLLLMQVAMRIERDFGLRLPLRTLFERPVLADLAREIEAVRAAQAETAAPVTAWPELRTTPRTERAPLAPSQLRLWMADRLAGPAGAAAYNMSAAIRLRGELDAARVARAIEALTERHAILRTVYPSIDGEPHACVLDAPRIELTHFDVSDTEPNAREAAVTQRIRARSAQPVDIERGPIFNAALIHVDAREHVLVFVIHHIASDGWSMGVLTRDFSALYGAPAQAALAPLPHQYADYAAWQREWLSGPHHARLQTFWREALADAAAEPPFATDFPRPATPSQAGASVQFTLGAPLRARVEQLAAKLNVTPFVVLLASFQLFVHRKTGVPDLLIGTDVAGRPLEALHDLVGFFVNVVPLRSRLSAQTLADSFAARVAAVREPMLAAFEHDALPFERIAEAAQIRRERRWHPLVQLLFVLQNAPMPAFALPGLVASAVPVPLAHSKFDMALFVVPHEDGWQVDWAYATSLFRHATIESFARAWQDLLENVVNHPNTSLTELFSADATPAAREAGNGAPAPASKAGKLKSLAARKRTREDSEAAAPRERALVRVSTDPALGSLPAFVEPVTSDLDPVAWAAANRRFIDELLQRHAMILFRNFNLPDPRAFEAFADAMSPGLYGGYGDLPKKEGGERTYKSTPYPEKEMILYHNESSHLDRWPRKQWFFCELPSKVGGATPVVDCRRMLRELSPSIVEKFERLSLRYVRTFTHGLDVAWQEFFKTDRREDVEARCRAADIEWQWLGENELQIRTAAPAVIVHPQTGEKSFFNQIQLHHPYFLKPEVRADLLKMVGAGRMPRSVRYGDGTEIEEAVLAEIARAYEACAIRFDWQTGDVAMLDNMLAAHARDPYQEPRKIVVAMGEMVDGRAVRWNRPASVAQDARADGQTALQGVQAR
ncbi:non-ribosomal peptide synthetase [Paraburkholderia sp. J63]|uniref:non-ribosomal peptide synthetase n=1 Tax=Paraburkholderia sp. J63 TaxID=2805434 RepID=UPI002ABE1B17|nr:non-ribosomal peptide synthetase [Paraburkholderia sp. J63]